MREFSLFRGGCRCWLPGGCNRVDFPQDLIHHFVFGLLVDVMDIDIPDNPLFIDDENGALGTTFVRSKHAIFLSHHAVGPEIAEQGIIDAAQAFCPGFDARDMIDANAQDLGV